MKTASITEVRKRFEEFVAMAEDGETIVVTRWGRPSFDLCPDRKPQVRAADGRPKS